MTVSWFTFPFAVFVLHALVSIIWMRTRRLFAGMVALLVLLGVSVGIAAYMAGGG